MIKFDKRLAAELAGVAAFFGIVTYLFFAFGLFEYFTNRQKLIDLIRDHRGYAELIFIGFQVLQVVAAPVPGEVTGVVGGVLFGTFWGILLSTIGLTLGSWLAFLLARLLGHHIIEVVARPETLKRYDYVMKHKGLFLAFIMFLIPGFPKDILCYLLGLGHMRQRDFLVISTTGRLLGTTLLTIGGAFLRNARYGAFFTVAGISLAAILVVMIYRESLEQWFRRVRLAERLRSRRERKKRKKSSGEAKGRGNSKNMKNG